MTSSTKGILAMIGSCIIWGLSSLIYKQLSDVPAIEVLAHRTLWSFVFFVMLLGVQGRLRDIQGSFSDRRSTTLTVLAALMILANWFLFIWSIETERATQASLGYYIYPLVSVVLGWSIFGEKLARLQWSAIALAAAAVSALTYGLGGAPWISLTLAGTFAIYGLLKKQLSVGPVVSVTSEVTLVAPFAVIFLLLTWHNGEATFGQRFGDHRTVDFRRSADCSSTDPVQFCGTAGQHGNDWFGRIFEPNLAVFVRGSGVF